MRVALRPVSALWFPASDRPAVCPRCAAWWNAPKGTQMADDRDEPGSSETVPSQLEIAIEVRQGVLLLTLTGQIGVVGPDFLPGAIRGAVDGSVWVMDLTGAAWDPAAAGPLLSAVHQARERGVAVLVAIRPADLVGLQALDPTGASWVLGLREAALEAAGRLSGDQSSPYP